MCLQLVGTSVFENAPIEIRLKFLTAGNIAKCHKAQLCGLYTKRGLEYEGITFIILGQRVTAEESAGSRIYCINMAPPLCTSFDKTQSTFQGHAVGDMCFRTHIYHDQV